PQCLHPNRRIRQNRATRRARVRLLNPRPLRAAESACDGIEASVRPGMARRMVGKVSALARYPVKSMLGEQLDELHFTERGAAGDRAYALRELVTRQIASAKKFPRL